jgi:hypothetical protein
MLFSLLFIIPLAHITYTDIKSLNIWVISMVAAILLAGVRLFNSISQYDAKYFFLLNGMVAITILATIWIYSTLKRKKLPQLFAWGDILFLLVLMISFSPLNFILFIIAASAIGIFYFIFNHLVTETMGEIPFAGIMAAFLGIVICIDQFSSFSTYSDQWIMNVYLY